MKKVKLFLYNYGNTTQIADFKNCGHDANICLSAMNDNQIKGHGKLPLTIFYYLEWHGKTGKHITVSYTGCNWSQEHETIVKTLEFKNSLIDN